MIRILQRLALPTALLTILAFPAPARAQDAQKAQPASAANSTPEQVSEPLQRARAYAANPKRPPRKVIGGAPAKLGDDPWQVALIDGRYSGIKAFCGGSILAEQWVVTAAHCVDRGTTTGDVNILAGVVDLTKKGLRLEIDEIVIRGDYAPNYQNDIALLHLKQSAQATKIGLIAPTDVTTAKTLPHRVAGWGAVAEDGPMRDQLLWADVYYFNRNICKTRPGYSGVTDAMICAGRDQGNADACQGDSGGPLSATVSGKRVLVGIVSWGQGCGRPEQPGVYTRIASFAPWIESCMRRGECYHK